MQTIDITSLAGKSIGEMLAELTRHQTREEELAAKRLAELVGHTVDLEFTCGTFGGCISITKLYDRCVNDNDGIPFPMSVLEDYLRLGQADSIYESVRGKGGGVRVAADARAIRRTKLTATIAALQAELDGLGL